MFHWKDHNAIFKGEGVYHLTFAVVGRAPLLGELVPLEQSSFYTRNVQRSENNNKRQSDGNSAPASKDTCKVATVDLSPLGLACSKDIEAFKMLPEDIVVCAKQIMPDHLHVVLWLRDNDGRSIRQIGNGFRIGIKKAAIELGLWTAEQGHILEVPYIRTLVHKGQLQSMTNYVHLNPDRAWIKRTHPDLFKLRRDTIVRGLRFSSMGNHWLLEWPDRQMVECSRSISDDDLAALENKVLARTENGAVTYTAAISKGEQRIARAVRETGLPLVVLLKDGFPKAGSESERYFKPGGVYFEACAMGRLLLLEATDASYNNADIMNGTEAALMKKAQDRGWRYDPIPHNTQRWRFMAGNVMVKRLIEDNEIVCSETGK